MKKLLSVLALGIVALAAYLQEGGQSALPNGEQALSRTPAPQATHAVEDELARAFAQQRSDVIVSGRGTVSRVLADDRDGDRHQRFILRLASGQTLLVAHNIDLAPRVAALDEGDAIAFKGEYEWNEQGGVLHWTHRDPAGRHVAGWLQHKGVTYQ